MRLLGIYWLLAFQATLVLTGAWGLHVGLHLPGWLREAKPLAVGAAFPEPTRSRTPLAAEALVVALPQAVPTSPEGFPCGASLSLAGSSPYGPWDELLRELAWGKTWETGGGPVVAVEPFWVAHREGTEGTSQLVLVLPAADVTAAIKEARDFLAASGTTKRIAALATWNSKTGVTGNLYVGGTGVTTGAYQAFAVDVAATLAVALGKPPQPIRAEPRLEWFAFSPEDRLAVLSEWMPARIASEESFRATLQYPLQPGALPTAVAWVDLHKEASAKLTAIEQVYDQLQVQGHIRRAQRLAGERWKRFGAYAGTILLSLLVFAIVWPPHARWAWLGALLAGATVWVGAALLIREPLAGLLADGGVSSPYVLQVIALAVLASILGSVVTGVLLGRKGLDGSQAGPTIMFYPTVSTAIAALALGTVAWLQGLHPGYPLPDLDWLAFGYAAGWVLAVVGLLAPLWTGLGTLGWILSRRPARS